jgi:hypothetical protein
MGSEKSLDQSMKSKETMLKPELSQSRRRRRSSVGSCDLHGSDSDVSATSASIGESKNSLTPLSSWELKSLSDADIKKNTRASFVSRNQTKQSVEDRARIMRRQYRELRNIVQTAQGDGINKGAAASILESFSGQGLSILSIIPKMPHNSLSPEDKDELPPDAEKPGIKSPVAAYKFRNAMSPAKRAKARDHWTFAIHSVKKINKATSLFKPRKMKYDMTIINSSTMQEGSIGYLLKSFQSKRDVAHNTRVQMYVSKHPNDRKEDHILELERMLSNRIPALTQKMSKKQRLIMCYSLRYLAVNSGRVVIKEGHVAAYFYIILSGQVEVTQKIDKKTLLRLTLLNKGDTFGEIGVEGILSESRIATVTANIETELLYITSDVYRSILMNEDTQIEQRKRKEILLKHKFFGRVPLDTQTQENFIAKSTMRIFEAGDVILQEGRQNAEMYFMISGSTSCRKLLSVESASVESKKKNEKVTKYVLVEYAKITEHSFPELIPAYHIGTKFTDDLGHLYTEIKRTLQLVGYSYPGTYNHSSNTHSIRYNSRRRSSNMSLDPESRVDPSCEPGHD